MDIDNIDYNNLKMQNFEQEFIIKMINDINFKKEELIKKRLKEMGLGNLFEDLKSRRFKRIMCEYLPTEEVYYADDGSLGGIRIITFKKFDPKFDFEKGYLINAELEYY